MDTIECVAAAEAKEQKHQEEKKKKGNNNAAFSLELITTATDPWMPFVYALKAPATKDKYIERLEKFLDFLGYVGYIEYNLLIVFMPESSVYSLSSSKRPSSS